MRTQKKKEWDFPKILSKAGSMISEKRMLLLLYKFIFVA